jgi:hypothetical protein
LASIVCRLFNESAYRHLDLQFFNLFACRNPTSPGDRMCFKAYVSTPQRTVMIPYFLTNSKEKSEIGIPLLSANLNHSTSEANLDKGLPGSFVYSRGVPLRWDARESHLQGLHCLTLRDVFMVDASSCSVEQQNTNNCQYQPITHKDNWVIGFDVDDINIHIGEDN